MNQADVELSSVFRKIEEEQERQTSPSFLSDAICFSDPDTGTEKFIVQPYWTRLIEELNERSDVTVKFHDTHKVATIRHYMPDILITTRGGSYSNIVALGELKGSDDYLGDARKGLLCYYLQELMTLQPYRGAVYGFLTNNVSLLLILAKREGQTVHFYEMCERKFRGGAAWKYLAYLATSSLDGLHYCNPINDIQEIKFLGCGHFSAVYSGIYNEQNVVVKIGHSEQKIQDEMETLQILQEVINVPKIVAKRDRILLLTPVGKNFSLETLRPQHIHELAEVLRQAHLKGLVHRDVRPPNILVTADNTALLIDWGSASANNCSPVFEGGIVEASDHILDSLISGQNPVPRPVDDLHALARSIYSITRRASLPLISKPPKMYQLEEVKCYWANTVQHWKDIFEKAEHCNMYRDSDYREFAEKLGLLL